MDNDSDLAIAIGYDAFKAGFQAGNDWAHCIARDAEDDVSVCERAWNEYTPPEELCGRNF